MVPISAIVREMLESQAGKIVAEPYSLWVQHYVRNAPWQSLRRDFPRQWRLVRDANGRDTGLGRRLAAEGLYETWLREDLIFIAGRDGRPLPADILGPTKPDAVRATVTASVARKHGRTAADLGLQAMRAWQMHELRERFRDLAEQAGNANTVAAVGGATAATGTAAIADYEPLTRTPVFEDYGGGLLADMAGGTAGGAVTIPAGSQSAGAVVTESAAHVSHAVQEVVHSSEDLVDAVVDGIGAVLGFLWDAVKEVF